MNPILEKAKQGVMDHLNPPQLGASVKQVVSAGEEFMYGDKGRQYFADAMNSGHDPSEAIGSGIAKMMGVLYAQGGKKMGMQTMIPAAAILTCEALQTLEDAGSVKVDMPLFEGAMTAMSSSILQMFGVSPEKLQGMVDQGQGGVAQPGAAPAPDATPAAAPAPAGIIGGAMGGA